MRKASDGKARAGQDVSSEDRHCRRLRNLPLAHPGAFGFPVELTLFITKMGMATGLILLLTLTLTAAAADDSGSHGRIPVAPGYPPGGIGYINWEFQDDFERLDIEIEILRQDSSKNFFFQLYQSRIGGDGVYFGFQNRVEHADQMLIFSRWGTRNLANVRVNAAQRGFAQSAGYEGDFVGVRLPGLAMKSGPYVFSLFKQGTDEDGDWFAFVVTDKSTRTRVWCGSIRFAKGARINRTGSTWMELYGQAWPVQTCNNLPKWDIKIKSIRGDGKEPLGASSSYQDPKWGDHIPMKNIFLDLTDNSFRFQLGPDIRKRNSPGRLR